MINTKYKIRNTKCKVFKNLALALMLAITGVLNPGVLFARQAIISYIRGIVEMQAEGSTFWVRAKPKTLVKEGFKVRTRKRSRATLLFKDGSRTRLGPGTTITMAKLSAPIRISQSSGRTRNRVSRLGRGFRLRTPTAICSVRGTDFSVGVLANGQTLLDVFEGMVNGLKLATGDSVDVQAGQSLSFDQSEAPLDAPGPSETPQEESELKQKARREVGLDLSRDQIQAAVAEEIKLAEYQEGKSLIDVNGFRVRLQEYILRKPKDVPEADRDKAFKFVVLNERQNRIDFFTYKGIFNKALPDDLSIALNNVSGRQLGEKEPEFYLRSYEMIQSNLTDAFKDLGDGGHLVKVTFDGTTYSLEAHGVDADGSAGAVTDTALQNATANGKVYDPVADVYKNPGTQLDGVYNPADDTFSLLEKGGTLWRTVFNRFGHLVGPASVLANTTLDDVPAGTLTQPWFQYYSPAAGITNIATLESINNAGLTSSGNLEVRGQTLDLISDQDIGHASFRYLNGNFAFDAFFPDSENADVPLLSDGIHQRLITYYPKDATDVPFEQFDTFIINDEGKVVEISNFSNATSGKTFKEELIKWNYEQQTRSSEFNGRSIDLVVEPKILIRSGLIQ